MRRFAPLLLGLGLLLAGPAHAQLTHVVTLGAFSFSPSHLTLEPGDTVRWRNNSGIHNVNGTLASYPSNPEGFGNTIAGAPWTYDFTFDLPGDYGYHCDVHGSPGFGMFGTLTVDDGSDGLDVTASGDPDSVPPGGTVTVTVTITNTSGTAVTLDGWLVVTRSGNVVLTRSLGGGTIPNGVTVTRSFALGAPSSTPPGSYVVTFYVGDFPDTVLAGDAFPVTVTTEPVAGTPVTDPDGAVFVVEEAEALFASSQAAPVPAVAVHPNPAQGTTTLRFALAAPAEVRLAVYDALGREVAVLVDGALAAGSHAAVLDGASLPAGVYVYRLATGDRVQSGRLTVVR
jgi:plastocyanin